MSNIAFNSLKCQEFLDISNKFQIEMINYFIRSTDRYENVYPSVKTIADEVGCSERSFYNHFPILEKMGIVKHTYDHRHSSTYQLNSLLFTHINVFKDKFKALKKIIHLSIRYPKVSAIRRCLKRCFTLDNFTQFLESICRPYKKTLTSLKKHTVSLFTRERDDLLSHDERQEFKLKVQFRRSRYMNKIEIPLILKEITEKVNLNKWGQIKLIAFPDDALKFALNRYRGAKNVAKPFHFIRSAAHEYCQKNNVEPDWNIYYQLANKYQMPENPECVSKVIPKPKAPEVPFFDDIDYRKASKQRREEELSQLSEEEEKKRKNNQLVYMKMLVENGVLSEESLKDVVSD